MVADTYRNTIASCQLFAGIGEDEIDETLELLGAHVREYVAGESVVRFGDTIAHAGIVLAGEVEGSFSSESFDQVDMERFRMGDDFGLALACLGGTSPMQVRAVGDCAVLMLDVQRVLACTVTLPSTQRFTANLALALAAKGLLLNRKVRILSQRGLRNRVLVYLRGLPVQPDGSVVLPLNITELARHINVNRSALSRELGRMMDDGVIRVEGRRVWLSPVQ